MAKSKKPKAGATGDFPKGKLNKDDEGGINILISAENGRVRIDFGKPLEWIAMNYVQALGLADVIIKKARELENGAGEPERQLWKN